MMSFKLRRTLGLSLLFLFSVLIFCWGNDRFARLVDTSIQTGCILIGMCLFLAIYNIRKKLPFLPLGKSSAWLQLHIYIGLLSFVVFLVHIGSRFPNGLVESIAGGLYALVFLSGVLGLYFTRSFPRRLSDRGGTIVYEEIPALRASLRAEAEKLALESIEASKKSTVADFYNYRLSRFFAGANNQIFHLLGTGGSLRKLDTAFRGVRRYLNEEELAYLARIKDLVEEKDILDFQYALQTVLKVWLFLHIPLTYSLLIFASFHGLLAWYFIGG